ncbi:MAG TPA: AAA family ATPase, partial [Marmoricola sp.]|nr:AAA family ATPase [Marmoricola sp.]
DIFNSLLQILDEGRLTDAQGRVVDFKNTVIIMTTNLGTKDIAKAVSLGFSQASDTGGSYEKMKAKVTEELKQHFRPEFLNRVDEIAEVDEELIAEVLAAATGIPVFKLTEEESSRLLNMEDELHKRVVGMDDAIKALSQAIRRTRAGLKDPRRPGGSFIFAGPTGVGKTELAKTLAEFLFGDEDSLIQLDMSEFSEKHTVSRLFGSPPGYVGYEEGGQLTEKVRRKPFSVVLFDEVEKAHPDIFNSLLQILEEGRLTDSQGRVVDFKNTVIIMTTNLGTRDISKGVNLGFQQSADVQGSYDRMKAKVSEELKQHFRPEFLNRVDEIVVFPPLSKEQIVTMVDMMVAGVDQRLRDRDMQIELTQAAKDLLAVRGFDPVLGARPLRRTVQREIEDSLAEKMLYGEVGPGQVVTVDVEGEGPTASFTFHGAPRAPITGLDDLPPIETLDEVAPAEVGRKDRE